MSEATLLGNKPVIFSGSAKHSRNSKYRSGKLFLLPDELVFQSDGFHFKNDTTRIGLYEIKEVKSFTTLLIIPNGLSIITRDGNQEDFILNNRREWKEKIEQMIEK
ncbi:hypothetical protein [Flavobacterium luminosum]|uniref:GRAM domain-containing protein n=1 Tax=Flavobacterium luminosum TaxID=2949086 RepID=A0ABT0TMX0_9FLAO|nr:hypothetical protein [Flavobacterium sp. HXWNR70]MCL9808838.1 hypothetical protein [Flavobacterium sp. HXWNR70]